MKKILILILGFGLLLFTGCNIPFFTKAQIKKYINTVEPKFNTAKVKGDEISKTSADEQEDIDKMKGKFEELKKIFEDAQATTKSQNPPSQANKLHQDLINYYETVLSEIDKLIVFYDFLKMSQDVVLKMSEIMAKIPDSFSNTDDLNKIASDLKKIKLEVEKIVSDLKAKKVEPVFEEAKNALIDLNQALVNILDKFIIGIDKKDKSYFDTSDFQIKINTAGENFGKETDVIMKSLDLDNTDKKIDNLESDVQKDLSDLKNKFKL